MAVIEGSITTGGAVTLTSGTLPAWMVSGGTGVGAQANGVYSGDPDTTQLGTIASIGSSSAFQMTGPATWAAGGGIRFFFGQHWQAAQNRWYYNIASADKDGAGNPSSASAVSAGPGYLGSDGNSSIDLGPAGISGVLWIEDDTVWPTAAGQPAFGDPAGFTHDCVAIQEGYDLSNMSDGVFFYATSRDTATPTELFPNGSFGGPNYYWPYGGICINEFCILVLALEVGVTGNHLSRSQVFWISNFLSGPGAVSSPSSWTVTGIQSPFFDGWPCMETANWYWDGDPTGWVYLQGTDNFTTFCTGGGNLEEGGTGTPGLGLYMVRFPYADLNISSLGVPSLANPQWWLGPTLGWFEGQPQRQQPTTLSRLAYASVLPPIQRTDSNGSIIPRSDSTFNRVLTNGKSQTTLEVGAPAPVSVVNVANVNDQSGLGYAAYYPTNRLSVPAYDNAAFTYFNKGHVEQTWSGKDPDDLLVTYATAPVGDRRGYFPEFVRLAGL